MNWIREYVEGVRDMLLAFAVAGTAIAVLFGALAAGVLVGRLVWP